MFTLARNLAWLTQRDPLVLRNSGFEPSNTGMNAMTNVTMGLQQNEDEILAFEVSDEALEIAAGTEKEKANYTLGACSGLSVCPG